MDDKGQEMSEIDDLTRTTADIVNETIDSENVPLGTRDQYAIDHEAPSRIGAKKVLEKVQEERLRASVDTLTGAWDREYTLLQLALMQQAVRADTRGDKFLALLMIDVDHFKGINDKYGHDAGDITLRNIAGSIKMNIKSADVLGRWGGEEFLGLQPWTRTGLIGTGRLGGPTREQIVRLRAEELRKRIVLGNETHLDDGIVLKPTVSIGMVIVDPNETPEQAIKRADVLLYQAKEQGRNRLVADIPKDL